MKIDSYQNPPVVMTIAGFDPSGAAGIIADVRTIESFGCAAVAAITSITFQNPEKYFGAIHQTSTTVRVQIESIVTHREIAAVKIGMLPTADMISELAWLLGELNLPAPVVDPVMESSTGGRLMDDDAFEIFVDEMLPTARLVTPNIPEAEKLAGMNIGDEEQMRQAAARIRELGARAVLIKGGHRYRTASGSERVNASTQTASDNVSLAAVDLLDDDGEVKVFRGEWIDAANVRGTGCKLSSAIAAGIANGDELTAAVAAAKEFVFQKIRNSKLKTEN
jgi:hydroxymethylpyrimidine kinase/phosphomethylpyrimidine kinase